MIFKNYYKILGLENNKVSKEEIKIAFREQAKKYHPDVNVGNKNSEERFKDINEAYRVLSETSTKRKYDRIWVRNTTNKRFSYSYNSKSDFLTMFFGTVPEINDDIKMNNKPCKGENLNTSINLKVSEAYFGVQKVIKLKSVDGNIKDLSINIPAGIKNKGKIKIKGQGKPGKYGGKNGDLIIIVNIEDKEFDLVGCNLIKTLKISPYEAVLGSKIKINGIAEDISVYIPAGTNSGETIKLDGKGYLNENGERGDLILQTQINIPKKCTDLEKEIYSELKKVSKFDPRRSVI